MQKGYGSCKCVSRECDGPCICAIGNRHLGLELNANVWTDEIVIAGEMKKNNASGRQTRTTTPARRDGTATATVAFLQKQWRRGPWARWIFHRVTTTERTALFDPFLCLSEPPPSFTFKPVAYAVPKGMSPFCCGLVSAFEKNYKIYSYIHTRI